MHNSQEWEGISWEHYSRILGSLGLLGTGRGVPGASITILEAGDSTATSSKSISMISLLLQWLQQYAPRTS
jgi:hypothetical protein